MHGWLALESVVVERDGRALALLGDPGCGKSTIAAHLMSRGWKLVTDDIAFVDEARGEIVGHHGLMRFRSGALPHLPAAFRATLERSKWFVGEDGELQFYEVDPESVFGPSIWSHEATFDSAIMLDDRAGAARRDRQREPHGAACRTCSARCASARSAAIAPCSSPIASSDGTMRSRA